MVSSEKEITFYETDREGIQDPHHDRLVIKLHMVNHFARRILVDRGSSANIVLLDALKRMNIQESEIINRSSVLIRFSGETKHMIREINLPIYCNARRSGLVNLEAIGVENNFSTKDYLE